MDNNNNNNSLLRYHLQTKGFEEHDTYNNLEQSTYKSFKTCYPKISNHQPIIAPLVNTARNETLLEACCSAFELVKVSWTAWAVFVLLKFLK